jgi:hypothetical protein
VKLSWDAVKPWVAKIAPMLGTALGGPLGGAAGSLLGSALGIKDASPESIKEAVTTGSLTGDQIVALKKAEQDFSLQCRAMGYNSVKELEELAFQDRDSARQREIQIKDWTPRILAYGVTLGFFGLLAYMLANEIPDKNRDVLNLMLGSLGTAWIAVITYYFGSSAGSAQKTEMLGKEK